MDKKVYIVHSSAIVQNGLANILRNNFKCIISSFSDFNRLSQSNDNYKSKAIFFVEDVIANSEEFKQFIEINEANPFIIITGNAEEIEAHSQYAIYLYNTPDEIYEQVKTAFNDKDFVVEETEGLSNREIDVLKLVAQGFANKEIADKLFISIHTVMSHRKNMTEKLGIKSISGLTVYAIINNYIDATSLDIKDLI